MTSTNDETKTLRTDTRGRVRVPVERREELLDGKRKAVHLLTSIAEAEPIFRDAMERRGRAVA